MICHADCVILESHEPRYVEEVKKTIKNTMDSLLNYSVESIVEHALNNCTVIYVDGTTDVRLEGVHISDMGIDEFEAICDALDEMDRMEALEYDPRPVFLNLTITELQKRVLVPSNNSRKHKIFNYPAGVPP